jgi:hypothetical protein
MNERFTFFGNSEFQSLVDSVIPQNGPEFRCAAVPPLLRPFWDATGYPVPAPGDGLPAVVPFTTPDWLYFQLSGKFRTHRELKFN